MSSLRLETRAARAGAAAADCSILGALELIGDYWTLGILRCSMYGKTRFGEFQAELGVATNILSTRLAGLVEAGLLSRRPYSERPPRHEYVLTASGAELLPALLSLKEWGDRHLRDDGPASVIHHEGCSTALAVEVRCPDCGEPVGLGALAVDPV